MRTSKWKSFKKATAINYPTGAHERGHCTVAKPFRRRLSLSRFTIACGQRFPYGLETLYLDHFYCTFSNVYGVALISLRRDVALFKNNFLTHLFAIYHFGRFNINVVTRRTYKGIQNVHLNVNKNDPHLLGD